MFWGDMASYSLSQGVREAWNSHRGPPRMEPISLAGRGGAGVEIISEENTSG